MKKIALLFIVYFYFNLGNLFAQNNLIPNPSFNYGSDDPYCDYPNGLPIEAHIYDWKKSECGVSYSTPDWMEASCSTTEPGLTCFDRFIYLANNDELNPGQNDQVRTGLLSNMISGTNYLFRITFSRVSYKYRETQNANVACKIILSRWSSSWCSSAWGNVRVSWDMWPNYSYALWEQHWVILNGSQLGYLFSRLNNINLKATAGAFYVDYVELSPVCDNPVLIENHHFNNGQNEMPYKATYTLKAGNDVGSPQPNGNVIVHNGANEVFKAGSAIYLEPGFEVETGGNFQTYIEGCNSYTANRLGEEDEPIQIMGNSYSIIDDSSGTVIDVYDDSQETLNCDSDSLIIVGLDGDTVSYISYQWDFGNGITSTEPVGRVFYDAPGEYLVTLILTDSSEVTDTLSKTYIVPECEGRYSYNNSTRNTFKIYPNPSSGTFSLAFNSDFEKIRDVFIYDPLYRIVFTKYYVKENNLILDLSTQPKGVYLVKIIEGSNITTQKIILM